MDKGAEGRPRRPNSEIHRDRVGETDGVGERHRQRERERERERENVCECENEWHESLHVGHSPDIFYFFL